MNINQKINEKRKCSEKRFVDLPHRVIVHKILVMHEMVIGKDEADPFLLFGYFKNDRLKNIWFIFTSIIFMSFDDIKVLIKKVTVDYSKVRSIYFRGVIVQGLAKISPYMYSLRSLGCFSWSSSQSSNNVILSKQFYSKCKFPKLNRFSLIRRSESSFAENWHECEFFDQLKYFELKSHRYYSGYNDNLDLSTFFRAKENLLGKNLKEIILSNTRMKEKLFIALHSLESIVLERVENMYIIPSGKNLKHLKLAHLEVEVFKHFARHSKNVISIEVDGKYSDCFFPLFEEFDFPNLKKLEIIRTYLYEKKWKFCSHIKELKISKGKGTPLMWNSNFFKINSWDQIEKLTIQNCSANFQIESVKFQNLRVLKIIVCESINDEFFKQFEGKKLEELEIYSIYSIISGIGWNKDIFKSLRILNFRHCEIEYSFFQQNEFPNLKKLILSEESMKFRESWKEMKSLEEIVVFDSLGFETSIFF